MTVIRIVAATLKSVDYLPLTAYTKNIFLSLYKKNSSPFKI